jgi:hypothetical protein
MSKAGTQTVTDPLGRQLRFEYRVNSYESEQLWAVWETDPETGSTSTRCWRFYCEPGPGHHPGALTKIEWDEDGDEGTPNMTIEEYTPPGPVFRIADTVTVLRDGRHIDTRPAAEMTVQSLITLMVGRDITNIFPKEPASRAKSSWKSRT